MSNETITMQSALCGHHHDEGCKSCRAAQAWNDAELAQLRAALTEADHLAALKAQRSALDDKIKLIEDGIRKAAHDASIAHQLVDINENRRLLGRPSLSMAGFLSGMGDALMWQNNMEESK